MVFLDVHPDSRWSKASGFLRLSAALYDGRAASSVRHNLKPKVYFESMLSLFEQNSKGISSHLSDCRCPWPNHGLDHCLCASPYTFEHIVLC